MKKLIETLEKMGEQGESEISPEFSNDLDLYLANDSIKCIGVHPDKDDDDDEQQENDKESIKIA